MRPEKEYTFETEDGRKTLAALFDGCSQLLVHHFMFGPKYATGCPVCSSAADTVDGTVVRLEQRDVTFVRVSRAPLETLLAYRRRMGWSFPWVSSLGSDFNFDFDVSHTEEQLRPFLDGDIGPVAELAAECGTDPSGYMTEAPGLSAFALEDGVVYHTYSSLCARYRGLDGLLPAARPGTHWAQRGRRIALDPPPRRIRGHTSCRLAATDDRAGAHDDDDPQPASVAAFLPLQLFLQPPSRNATRRPLVLPWSPP